MKLFVTGAGGYIGGHVVEHAIAAGHDVTGMVRSEEKAAKVRALGATAFIGNLEQPSDLAAEAKKADAVLHLAFLHDFSRHDDAIQLDLNFAAAINEALEGSNKAFIATSGIAVGGEEAEPWKESDPMPNAATKRVKCEEAILKGAQQGVRAIVLRLAAHVYGYKGAALANIQAGVAKKRGVAAYTAQGVNKTTAAHVDDIAKAYLLALQHGEAGHIYNIASEDPTAKEIADALAKREGVRTESVTPDQAKEIFGPFLGMMFAINATADTSKARSQLHWQPAHSGDFLKEIAA